MSAGGREVVISRDTLGRVDGVMVAGLAPVAFTYDESGRVIAVERGEGASGRQSTMAYGSDGAAELMVNGVGDAVTMERDAMWRVRELGLPDGHHVSMDYEPGGNLSSLTPPARGSHSLGYSEIGYLERYSPPMDDGVTGEVLYSHDLDRRPRSLSFADGRSVTWAYDSVGRVEQVAVGGDIRTMSYDPVTGQLITVDSPEVTLSLTWDGSLKTSELWSGAMIGTREGVDALNELYTNEWRLFHNFYCASVRLIAKTRDGAKVTKQYDAPKTPYQRVMESKDVSDYNKARLRELYENTNPFTLRRAVDTRLRKVAKTIKAKPSPPEATQ